MVEPLVHHLQTGMNRNELGVDRLEPLVLRRKSRMNLRESQVHLGKTSIDQSACSREVFFESFAGHISFEKSYSLVE